MSTPEIDRKAVRKILIIKLRAIGDVLLSTVVIPNLNHAFPDVPVDFLTEPPSEAVVRGNPGISEVIVFDKKRQSGISLIKDIRQRKYDLVMDLFGNPRTALVTRWSGARYRVGFRFRGRTYAYTTVVSPRGGMVHNTQFNLDAIEALGIETVKKETVLPISESDEKFATNYFEDNKLAGSIVVVLNASGGWYTKRWGGARFAEFGDRIASAYGARIVLTWGPGEKEQAEQIRSMMKSEALIPPPTSLRQMGALLKRASLMITNDSGPMHIAASFGVPIVAIYGPTNPVLQGPYGTRSVVLRNESVPCLGCNLVQCPINHPCMEELTAEQVWERSREFMTGILGDEKNNN